jgi:sensor histidine kinase YesM
MIQVYLELQQLRFEQQFDFRIEVDDTIEPDATKIPPMLAQPFIENAVEHGIRHKPAKGFVHVLISKNDDKIGVVVTDDGVGRDAAAIFRKKVKPGSLATSITIERLRVLGRKYRQKFLFEIDDLKDESGKPAGTRVRLQMPAEKSL